MRGLQTLTDSLQAIAPVLQGRVAQSVEQRIENPRVASSILAPATTLDKPYILCRAFSFLALNTY